MGNSELRIINKILSAKSCERHRSVYPKTIWNG